MSAVDCVYDVEVEAPDGPAAVELEKRLWFLTPTTVGHGNEWIVEIPGPVVAAEVEAVVRAWLDDIGCGSTAMRFEGRVHTVAGRGSHSPMHVPTHHDFVG